MPVLRWAQRARPERTVSLVQPVQTARTVLQERMVLQGRMVLKARRAPAFNQRLSMAMVSW